MANEPAPIVFHHAPWSRSASIRWLLEELGVDYEVRVVHVQDPNRVSDDYRNIQPHKKVPAIEHGSVVVTERAAITIYLADVFPQAGLAPAVGDPMRAAYLTALVYVDAVFDPCVTAHCRGLKPAGADYSFGAYDDVMSNLERRLTQHPFAAGARFTAADTQLASALGFTIGVLKAVPNRPAFEAYLARVADRPAHVRATELDAKLAQTLFPQTADGSVATDVTA